MMSYWTIGCLTSEPLPVHSVGTIMIPPVINASAIATRRDYVLANNAALKHIQHFKVDRQAGLPVHAVLQVRFNTKPMDVAYDKVHLPKSIHSAFKLHCQQVYRNDNLVKGQTLRLKISSMPNSLLLAKSI